MKPTAGYLGFAWVRDHRIPPGQPAPGKINCPCGKSPESRFSQKENVICECGIVCRADGLILGVPKEYLEYRDGDIILLIERLKCLN